MFVALLHRCSTLPPHHRNVTSLSRISFRSFASASVPLSTQYPESDEETTTTCNKHVIKSPFPGLSSDHVGVPFPEFVSRGWLDADGVPRDKVAMIDAVTGQHRTFRDYYYDTASIAAHLQDLLGMRSTTTTTHSGTGTVALFSPNHVDYVPICLAAGVCGAKLTPINPMFKAQELHTILSRSESDVLIAHSANVDVAMEAIRGTQVTHLVILSDDEEGSRSGGRGSVTGTGTPVGSVPEGSIRLSDLKTHSSPLFDTHHVVHGNAENYAYLLPYSSGTTGMPKGVCLSHTNLISNLLQLKTIETVGRLPFDQQNKLISPLPFFHIYGWLVSALYSVWQGHEVVTMGRFDLEQFCQAVEMYQPNRAHLVPPIVVGLAKHPVVDQYDLSSLQMIVSAAAPLAKETEQAVLDRIGCPIKQGWGMSELSPIAIYSSDLNRRSGSVGQLVPDTWGKVVSDANDANRRGIVNENGTHHHPRSLGPHERGELMIKGPQVMMGYLNDEERTAECLDDDGWLRTGDVATYDEDGFFYIVDRKKELIKVRGYQVAPAELEALLLTHPKVSDAAVVPVPDEVSGELPRAYVSLKAGVVGSLPEHPETTTIQDEIKAFVKEHAAPYKRLEGGVIIIEQVPKSASGKILRRVLVDRVKAEAEKTS